MATLKHIASKNSDYAAIEAYLVYQHDAFTGKQLLDEQGKPKLRDSYLLDTRECGDFSFATACLLANRKYGKNTQHGDIKSHQYIISFDPRDAADNGLTMEKAQALGLKFCEENFPGHPAIVCTHPDGHNHSGNIHVHIVIGSIRMREVERKPYMQKPRDWREGMKHSSTAQTMRHLRVEVMELCEGAGLYQIDLLNGSKERVSEAEYWKDAQPEKAGSRVCAAGIRKGKILRAVQGSQRGTAQTENRKAECCVLFPGGRTDAAGEIKECAYDQSENRPGVPVPDSSSDR